MRKLRVFRPVIFIFGAITVLLAITGCGGLKDIPEGKYLLAKNTIKSDRPELRESMSAILKQKPNRKILGVFRFHLGVWRLANRGKETKVKRWLKNTIGEEPVLLDTMLMKKSSDQISIFMQNNGFFNVQVDDSVVYHRKTARIIFDVHSGEPYTIRKVYHHIEDSAIAEKVYRDTAMTLLRPGYRYSTALFQKERERISNQLRNEGYYFFNQQYIVYKADTSLQDQLIDLYMIISNPRYSLVKDSIALDTVAKHRLCYYDKVYVEMDYDPILLNQSTNKDTLNFKEYQFISNARKRYLYKPNRLIEHIFVQPDSLFNQGKLDLTYRRLADLSVFRFVNIRFDQGFGTDSLGRIPLTTYLLLSPQPRQEYKIEAEGTNSGGNLGVAGNFSYRNKNIFRGAESLLFRIKAGVELQRNFSDTTYQSIKQFGFFNAYEIGPDITLNFPRFLSPFGTPWKRLINNPSTSIAIGYNIQNRPEYYRQLANLSYYNSWKSSPFLRHYIYWGEINYLRVNLDPAFRQQLLNFNDINILLGYTDQLISDGRYSFVYSNQQLNVLRNYSFLRFNIEFAGNSVYAIKKLEGEKIDAENPSRLFGVRFAQYVRPDFDFRYYNLFSKSRMIVFRIASGIGYSYGNSLIMPFEKSFFAGGSNDNRAWRSRSVGPGSSVSEELFERFGDIKINGNVEYRFDILRKLKGAAFVDGGNVWLLRQFTERPGGTFKLDSFADEIAIGGGLGIRFDFSFFIIRLDGAVKLKDPSMPVGERWVFDANQFSDITFNFGIGYPF